MPADLNLSTRAHVAEGENTFHTQVDFEKIKQHLKIMLWKKRKHPNCLKK